ncbi:MAG: TfoX/Sxy family protein [Cyanobacteria bacterium HKST-UBA02]|nr:TfoX/Sxy family protein [Cyanobacteria bacterium HKST-UBA02]
MVYDPELAERLAAVVGDYSGMEPKKMFGGVAWLLNGNMCVGVHKDRLIIRIGSDSVRKIAGEPHVGPMDITGRPMKGWAIVAKQGLASKKDLERFISLAVDFVAELPPKY